MLGHGVEADLDPVVDSLPDAGIGVDDQRVDEAPLEPKHPASVLPGVSGSGMPGRWWYPRYPRRAMPTGSATTSLRHWWPALAAVAAACLLPLPGLWQAPGPPMEEGFMLVFPERVLAGDVPNRDFLHLYGPGSLWVLAGVMKVFGVSIEVERIVGFLQQLLVATGVLALLRPWGRWVAGAGAVVTALIVVPPIGLTALPWVGGVGFGLWALVAGFGAAGRPARLAAAGLLAGVAMLYRPDLVLAVVASGLVLAAGLEPADRRRLGLWTLAGVSPYVIHLVMAGPRNVFDGLFIEPVFHLRGGRSLPLPPSWDEFDGFLQRAGQLIEPPWPLPAPPSPGQLTLWFLLLVATVGVLVLTGISVFRRGGDRRLLVLGLFAAGLLPQALQRADSTHLAWVSCVPLGFLPAAVAELLARYRPSFRHGRVLAALTPVVLLVVLVPHFTVRTWSDYVARGFEWREVGSYVIEHRGREFRYGRADAVEAVNEMLPVVEQVSEPGQTLLVGTGDLSRTPYSEAFLYHLLPQLPPATRYIEMDPGVADAPGSGLAEEVAAADVVILSSIRDDWDEPNDSRHAGSNEPNEVLARDFCMVGSYGEGLFGRGLYELYTRCDRSL